MATSQIRPSRYAQLKQDTSAIATWLSQTVSDLERNLKTDSASRRVADQAPKLSSQLSTEFQASVKTDDLRKLADRIIAVVPVSLHSIPRDILINAIATSRRCVLLRKGQSAGIRSQQDHNATLQELQSNLTHDYFTDSIQYVFDKLRGLLNSDYTASTTPATPARASAATASSVATSNELSNLFEHLELFDSKELSMPATKTPAKKRAPRTVLVQPADNSVEALVWMRLLLQDLTDLRNAILDIWAKYATRDISLSATGLAHNTAIDFARILETEAIEEFSKQANASSKGSNAFSLPEVGRLLEQAFEKQCKTEKINPKPPKHKPYIINPASLHIADPLMIVSKRLIEQHLNTSEGATNENQSGDRLDREVKKIMNFFHNSQLLNEGQTPFNDYAEQEPHFPNGSKASTAQQCRYKFNLDTPCYQIFALHQVAQHSRKLRSERLAEGIIKGALIEDELSRGIEQYQQDGRLPLWLIFAFDTMAHVQECLASKGMPPLAPWRDVIERIERINVTMARSNGFETILAQLKLNDIEGDAARKMTLEATRHHHRRMHTLLQTEFGLGISENPHEVRDPSRNPKRIDNLRVLPALAGLWQYAIDAEYTETTSIMIQHDGFLAVRFSHMIWVLQQYANIEPFPELKRYIEHYGLAKKWQGTVSAGVRKGAHTTLHQRICGLLETSANAEPKLYPPVMLSTPLLEQYKNRFDKHTGLNRLDWSHVQFHDAVQKALAARQLLDDEDLAEQQLTAKHSRQPWPYDRLIRSLGPCLDEEIRATRVDIPLVTRMLNFTLIRILELHEKELRQLSAIPFPMRWHYHEGWHSRVSLAVVRVCDRLAANDPKAAQCKVLLDAIARTIKDTASVVDPGNGEMFWGEVRQLWGALNTLETEQSLMTQQKIGYQVELRHLATAIWNAPGEGQKQKLQKQWMEKARSVGVTKPVALLEAIYAYMKPLTPHLVLPEGATLASWLDILGIPDNSPILHAGPPKTLPKGP